MSQLKILVIGGSAAGPKTAARARRLLPDAEITILQKSPDLSMASCGYPYYVGGLFDDRNELLSTPVGTVRDIKFYTNAKGIDARVCTEATAIDREHKTVSTRCTQTGKEKELSYDKLVLCTGAIPVFPELPGKDLEGISTLQSMADTDYLRQVHDDGKAGKIKEAVVIGGGLIGVETCEALADAGIKVTLVEMLPQILAFLDPELAKPAENYLKSMGVNVITSNAVTEFTGKDGRVSGVTLKDGTSIPCQAAVVSIGVRPNATLAEAAGLELGEVGGVTVNEYLQTSDPDIYAAGDCCEMKHLVSGRKVHVPYGDLANLEGRVVARNIAEGNTATFTGTIGTGICKAFDWTIGSTGLSEQMARRAGMDDITTVVTAMPDKPHFMGAKLLIMKMIADHKSGKLIGFQAVGPGDVSRRVATAATAIQSGMTVAQITTLDLPYAPPYSAAIDAFITTSHVLENKMRGLMESMTAVELKGKLAAGEKPFLLDVRSPGEYEQMRLGLGETLIPLGKLRASGEELPSDKSAEIVVYCKISLRGWEAASYLKGAGYSNVKVLEGGIMAWPFGREK